MWDIALLDIQAVWNLRSPTAEAGEQEAFYIPVISNAVSFWP